MSVVCSNCGNINRDSANFCGYCGIRLPSTVPVQSDEVVIPEKEGTVLLEHLARLREQIGDIPSAFTSGKSYDIRHVSRFDANRYFEVFDRVKCKDGYTLDYVYQYDGLGGYPLLYTRKTTSKSITSPQEFRQVFTGSRNLMEHIEFERSALGYWQFALFSEVAPLFYLWWHAGYRGYEFIFSRDRFEQVVSLIHSRAQLESVDRQTLLSSSQVLLNPRVKINGDTARVTMVAFTGWGGLFYHHSQIRWPNTVENTDTENIAPYDCGIMF